MGWEKVMEKRMNSPAGKIAKVGVGIATMNPALIADGISKKGSTASQLGEMGSMAKSLSGPGGGGAEAASAAPEGVRGAEGQANLGANTDLMGAMQRRYSAQSPGADGTAASMSYSPDAMGRRLKRVNSPSLTEY